MNEKNDRADAVFVFGRFPPYSEGANFHPFFVSDVKLFFRGGPAPRMVCTQVAGRKKTIEIFWKKKESQYFGLFTKAESFMLHMILYNLISSTSETSHLPSTDSH